MGDEGADDRQGSALEEEREAIRILQSEQARKLENLDRLKQKIGALREELQARKSDLSELDADLQNEARLAGKAKESAGRTKTEEVINTYMKSEVRRLLQDRVPVMAEEELDGDDRGQALQDRQDQAQEEAATGQDKVHDTVLVSYVNYQPDSKMEDFKVSIRIDRDTTVDQLHKDGCAYWGCSTRDFVLCRLEANEPKSLESKMSMKLQSEHVLNPAEEAHLHLVRREHLQAFADESKRRSAEAERKAASTQVSTDKSPEDEEKMKFKTLRHTTSGAVAEQQDESFVEAVKPWPGVYSLLRSRQRRPLKLGNMFKFRDIAVFGLLTILNGICLNYRGSPNVYHVVKGVEEALIIGRPGETSGFPPGGIVNFNSISSWEEWWAWLGGSFHYQVFSNSSMLHKFYVPVGHIRIRQQMAREINCPNSYLPDYITTVCSDAYVSPTDQDKQTMILENFINMSEVDAGRMASPDPRVWQPSPVNSETYTGHLGSYDQSGYQLVYSTAASKLNASGPDFFNDLVLLRDKWVNTRTRMMAVEMVVANYHSNGFVALMFVAEVSASGAFVTSYTALPFRLGLTSYDGAAHVLDVIRAIIIFGYVAMIKVYQDCKFEFSCGRKGLQYVVSGFGFVDASIVAMLTTLLYMRSWSAVAEPSAQTGFYPYTQEGGLFRQLGLLEAVFFSVVIFRWASYFRIYSNIYLFWKICGNALRMMVPFMAFFIPLLLALIFFASSAFHHHLEAYSSWEGATLQILLALRYQLPTDVLSEKDRVCTFVLIAFFFLAVTCLFGNAFLAITVHAAFETELLDGAAGDSRETWSWDKGLKWMLWAPLYRLIFGGDDGESEDWAPEEADADVDDEDAENETEI